MLEKNAAFIPERHFNMFGSIGKHAYELGYIYPEIRIIDDAAFRIDRTKMARDNNKKTTEFNEEVAQAKKAIRDYLASHRAGKE